jgi:hypothetical protein
VLHQFGGIEGLALDAAGAPIANAAIEIHVAYGNDRSQTLRLTTDAGGEFVSLDGVPATDVYLDIRITSTPDGVATSATWQSDLIAVPVEQVVVLGAIPFAFEQAPAGEQKSMLAQQSPYRT